MEGNLQQQTGAVQQPATIKTLAQSPALKSKMVGMWNDERMANSFLSSIVSVAYGNPQLRGAEPNSVVAAAMVAASMQLQIIPTLGQAYIVPFRNNRNGTNMAQFQIGYIGLLQLCLRSGQFKRIITAAVHEGELVSGDEFSEDYVFDAKQRESDSITGYMAKFELLNGFIKTAYWDTEKVKKHALKYSQTYRQGRTSPWQTEFDKMAEKTVLKSILKYAPKSVEMQRAIIFDQAVIKTDGVQDVQDLEIDAFIPEYVDNEPASIADTAKARAAELRQKGGAE